MSIYQNLKTTTLICLSFLLLVIIILIITNNILHGIFGKVKSPTINTAAVMLVNSSHVQLGNRRIKHEIRRHVHPTLWENIIPPTPLACAVKESKESIRLTYIELLFYN